MRYKFFNKKKPASGPSAQCGQRGTTLLGTIVYLLFAVFVAVLAINIYPSVQEYYSIRQTVKKLATTPSIERARVAFDQAAREEKISSITGRDLDIVNEGGSLDIRFAYRKEIKLVGPVSVLIDYSGDAK